MPQPPRGLCTFDATAREVRVVGKGAAVLLHPKEPFTAATVRLVGAEIAGVKNVTLDRPAELEPVKMNRPEQPYDVTYRAGAPIVIDVTTGGTTGGFRGALDGGADCAGWCDVTWSRDAKHIEIDTRAESVLLAGPLPLRRSELASVEVRGLRDAAVVKCPDGDRPLLPGDWTWKVGPLGSLSVKAIRAEAGVLRVQIEDEAAPAPARLEADAGVADDAGTSADAGAPVTTATTTSADRSRSTPVSRDETGQASTLWTGLGVGAVLVTAAVVGAVVLVRGRGKGSTAEAGSRKRRVRVRIGEVLKSDADLNAFCLDFFPEVHERFTNGMDRVDKVNLLLERIETGAVEAKLHVVEREREAKRRAG